MRHVRYTGTTPITFSDYGREVVPGDVIMISDELLDSFARRDDIELLDLEIDHEDDVMVVLPSNDVTITKRTVSTKTAD